jgi:hypothetical protein
MALVGLYLEGVRSMLVRLFPRSAGRGEPDWLSLAAASVLLIFAFAWKKSYRLGLAIQILALALIVGWAVDMDPSVLRNWVAYTPPVAALAVAMAAIVSALLWKLTARRAG